MELRPASPEISHLSPPSEVDNTVPELADISMDGEERKLAEDFERIPAATSAVSNAPETGTSTEDSEFDGL
jgi:hypothetical protein